MIEIHGNACDRNGIMGNCGLDCEAYLQGECEIADEIAEELEGEELQRYKELYGGEDIMASVSGEETCRQCYYYKKVYVGGFNCEHPESNNTRVFTTYFGKCDRFTRYEKKKLTCKNCKYYDEVSPDWTYAKSSTFRCSKRQCNMTSLSAMCSNGPFLPEAEKEEHKCEICGKSCDKQWPEHEHKWLCLDCHWGLHDDVAEGTDVFCLDSCGSTKYKYKVKGNKMKKLVKVLRRVIMLWVVYGAVKLGILVNPLMVRLGYYISLRLGNTAPEGTIVEVIVAWFFVVLSIAVFCAASYALHRFSAWIFNEKN